jgi:histidine ammonia-lyase
MPIIITGKNLKIEDVYKVAVEREKIQLHPDAEKRILDCRAFIEKRIEAKEIMYGVNTGIGELASVVLTDEQVQEFQKYLIYNHAAGIGEPAPVEHIRAAMLSRINVHANGYSGCRLEITKTYIAMLNEGVTPVVCAKGSVGACGDLSPMSQIALSLMGEGESFYKGERIPTVIALEKAGISIPGLKARDGLAAINGSNLMTGMACIQIYEIERLLKQAEIATAMSLEALMANLKPYDERLHKLRGFKGAVTSSRNIKKMIEGSDLLGNVKVKVQDAYSMRSSPQVIGAARDQLRWTREQVETELNGVADNPIFLCNDKIVLTGANFQGSPISVPLDLLGAAVTMVCVLSERRLNRLLNPALSVGLPAFLTKGAGMFSGHMLSQYTADMLIVEQRILSMPASIQSIPAAADQEDFVSMGMNTALKTRQIIDNSYGILGIEFIAAAQALDFREYKFGKGTTAAHAEVRKVVKHLDVDRPLFNDHNNMMATVRKRTILYAVESAIGELETY